MRRSFLGRALTGPHGDRIEEKATSKGSYKSKVVDVRTDGELSETRLFTNAFFNLLD